MIWGVFMAVSLPLRITLSHPISLKIINQDSPVSKTVLTFHPLLPIEMKS
jgi:hypothetical protein